MIEVWPLYATVSAYALKTFASPALSCFYLSNWFCKKPQDLLNLAFPQLEQFVNTHKGYLQLLNEKDF